MLSAVFVYVLGTGHLLREDGEGEGIEGCLGGGGVGAVWGNQGRVIKKWQPLVEGQKNNTHM